ncbi:MAG: hypothetical protein H2212_00175 [Ruminococcus sp.]|nr:hypothetical protein [Ruminococcus sp.]
MNRSIWLKKIRYIENLKDEELIKTESYSVLVSFILSKDEFKRNSDLKDFMTELGIDCKPYLLKSRTSILGRAIREVQKFEDEEVLQYLGRIRNRIQDETDKDIVIEKKSKENYMKKMLERYGRKE